MPVATDTLRPKSAGAAGTVPKTASSGRKRGPGGSRKGIPNKATVAFRETVQKLLDDNRDNVALWLTQVAEGTPDRKVGKLTIPGRAADPGGALLRLAHLAEFASPKLNRSEVVGEGGGPLTVVIRKEA